MSWQGGLLNGTIPASTTSAVYNYITEAPLGVYDESAMATFENEEAKWFSTSMKYAKGTLKVYLDNVLVTDIIESDGSGTTKNQDFYLPRGIVDTGYVIVKYVPRDKANGYTKSRQDLLAVTPCAIVNHNSSTLTYRHFFDIEKIILSIESAISNPTYNYITNYNVLYLNVGSKKIVTEDTMYTILQKGIDISISVGSEVNMKALTTIKTNILNGSIPIFDASNITNIRAIFDNLSYHITI